MEQMQAITWNTIDDWQTCRGFVVQCFGRLLDTEATAVCLEIEGFVPSFRLKITKSTTKRDVEMFYDRMCSKIRGLDQKIKFDCRFPLYPYTEYFERFIVLRFNGEYSRKQAANFIRQLIEEKSDILLPGMQLFDAALPSLLAMQHERGISPSGHIVFPKDCVSVDFNGVWHIQYTSVCPFDDDRINRFVVASFDIESLSYESYVNGTSIFPDFTKPKDCVSQIGTTVAIFGTDQIQRHIFVLDTDDKFFANDEKRLIIEDEDNVNFALYPFSREQDLLMAWSLFIQNINPDILTGYNIFGFDYNYIHERCVRYGIDDSFSANLSRTQSFKRMFQSRQLSSSAYGDNNMTFYDIPGRLNFDLYLHMKKEYRLDSYKLDNVSEHFLNRKKLDMPPHRLFQYLKQSRESIIEVAKYCVRDCDLVYELLTKLKIFPTIIEMSNTAKIPLSYVLLRGQQIRCFSLISFHAGQQKYAVPDKIDRKNDASVFEGGYVMTPQKEVFMNDPICVLDVMSLYPSIIIAYNLCYSTVHTATTDLPTEQITSVKISNERTHCFVKQETRIGLLSHILKELWTKRQSIKKQMKTCDASLYPILDARQLSIKTCMNSLYGLTGVTSDYAMLSCPCIAESITCLGRQTIQFCKFKIEEWYGDGVVRYIDSDSLFICFSGDTQNNLKCAFSKGFEAEHRLNEILLSPIKMEFEKVMYPFVILTKKRYCGLVFEDEHDLTKSKILYKGISVVRRDFCNYTKKTIEEAMNIVFMERDISKAYEYVRSCVKNLIEGHVSMDSLVMSKTLSSKHTQQKDPCSSILPHVALYGKLQKRDPNNCPKSGERISFVYVMTGDKLLRDKVESPENISPTDLDLLYYYEHQLYKPIEELFGLLVHPEPFDPIGSSKSVAALLRKHKNDQAYMAKQLFNKRNNQNEITMYFSKRVRENIIEEKKEDMSNTSFKTCAELKEEMSEEKKDVLYYMPSMKYSREQV